MIKTTDKKGIFLNSGYKRGKSLGCNLLCYFQICLNDVFVYKFQKSKAILEETPLEA
jgi:hypothetical protein